jgi:hypothetical protein
VLAATRCRLRLAEHTELVSGALDSCHFARLYPTGFGPPAIAVSSQVDPQRSELATAVSRPMAVWP